MTIIEKEKPMIEQISGTKVVKDTGWEVTFYSRRGITDYVRFIEFSEDVSDDSRYSLCKLLNEEGPGNFGVAAYTKDDPRVIKFMTTYDSSD